MEENNDALNLARELCKVQLAANRVLQAIDALDGEAEMPYRQAKELAVSADVLRIILGHDPKIT